MLSDQIAHEWVKGALATLRNGCDHIVKYDFGKDFFTLLNIDHQSPPQESLKDKTLHYRLHDRLHATHVVILTPIASKDTLQIKTSVESLAPYGEDSLRSLPAKLVMNHQQTATINKIPLSDCALSPSDP